jgi:hypothetical protein
MDRERQANAQLTAIVGTTQPRASERLPLRLANVQQKARLRLQDILARMFDQADDALFEMADRAGSNHEQNIYFESMRELRLRRRGIELAYAQHFDASFDQLALAMRESQGRSPEQLSAGRREAWAPKSESLTLVHENEIEEVVAIESMVTRTLHAGSDELSLLSMRFESLLKGVRLDNDNNPLAPQPICNAFTRAYKDLDIDIKARLFVLKLYEKYVLRELAQLYRVLNRDLAEEGVLTNMSLADQARRKTRHRDGEDNVGSASRRHAATEAGFGADKDTVFSQLQGLLMRSLPFGGSASHHAASADDRDAVKIVRRSMVLDVLSTVQSSVPKLATGDNGYVAELPPARDVRQIVEQMLNEQGGEGRYELGREDEDAINIVSLMFRFILDDGNLGLPLKSQLSMLQVPMAKVALLDKSFFGKNNHPAKKLFNTLAHASIGWEPANNAARDFLYRKVCQSVKTVLSRFEDNIGVFQEVLADFSAFLENERRRAGVVEQRTLEAEKGRARSAAARQRVAAAIKHCMADKYLPAVVAELLEHAWSKVLFLIYARDGESSDSWKSAVQVMEELVWSVQRKPGEAERRRLERLMPHLLKSVRVGLSRVGFSYFAMNHFFEQLDSIHRCLLERTPPAQSESEESISASASTGGGTTLDALLSGKAAPAVAVGRSELEPQGEESEVSLEQSQCLAANGDGPAAVSLAIDERELTLLDSFTPGCWIQFNQSKQIQFRCRLAAVMQPVGQYIFVNRSGKKVAEWSREQLAANVASEIVVLLDDRLLFDRALESVISQLQKGRH